MEWPAPGLCPGAVGRNASTFPSNFLMGRKAIVVFVVYFVELGMWPLFCLKFLPFVKSNPSDKTNNRKKKQVRAEYAMAKDRQGNWNMEQRRRKQDSSLVTFQSIHGIRNLKSQGDQNLANHEQRNVHGGLETPNAIQSPPTPPSEATPSHNIDDFRPTAPGHSPGVGHSVHN
ncbi:hypothetical protein K1719_015499 [Acacia pycnantha]|nr:hypothetical protein K1719_015499 [Acacia pycnantha]